MKKLTRITAVAAAMLLAMASLTACGSKEESKKEESTGAASSASSASSQQSAQPSAQESSKLEISEFSKQEFTLPEISGLHQSSQQQSSQQQTSEQQSLISDTPTGGSNMIFNDSGIVIADDPAINNGDTTSESILNMVLNQKNMSSSMEQFNTQMQGKATAKMFAKGNALVIELDAIADLTDEQKQNIGPSFESNVSSVTTPLTQMKDQYGISMVVVVAVVENNGNVCFSKVLKG